MERSSNEFGITCENRRHSIAVALVPEDDEVPVLVQGELLVLVELVVRSTWDDERELQERDYEKSAVQIIKRKSRNK